MGHSSIHSGVAPALKRDVTVLNLVYDVWRPAVGCASRIDWLAGGLSFHHTQGPSLGREVASNEVAAYGIYGQSPGQSPG